MTMDSSIEQARTVTRSEPSVTERRRGWISRFARGLRRCAARRRQRIALAELSDRQLADLGLAREAAMEEAHKPFWR